MTQVDHTEAAPGAPEGTVGVGCARMGDNGPWCVCAFKREGGKEILIQLAYDQRTLDLIMVNMQAMRGNLPP